MEFNKPNLKKVIKLKIINKKDRDFVREEPVNHFKLPGLYKPFMVKGSKNKEWINPIDIPKAAVNAILEPD